MTNRQLYMEKRKEVHAPEEFLEVVSWIEKAYFSSFNKSLPKKTFFYNLSNSVSIFSAVGPINIKTFNYLCKC